MKKILVLTLLILTCSAYASQQTKVSGDWKSYLESNGVGIASTRYESGKPYFMIGFSPKPIGCHYPMLEVKTVSDQSLNAAEGQWSTSRMFEMRVVGYPRTWHGSMTLVHLAHSKYIQGIFLGAPAVMGPVLNELRNGTRIAAGVASKTGKIGANSWSLRGSGAAIARAERLCEQN